MDVAIWHLLLALVSFPLLPLPHLTTYFNKVPITAWADWLGYDAQCIRASDFYGVRCLLRAFGGMGSLNDLALCPANGHPIAEHEVAQDNTRFDQLTSAVYDLAQALKQEQLAAYLRENEARPDGSTGT